MTNSISYKRQLVSIVLAWVVFIGIDFLFHASLVASLWNEEIPALKPLDDLALLIPAGYLSFFLLTFLVGYIFFMIFKAKPPIKRVIKFGFVFALLFSISNFLGLFSYVALPVKHLVVFNLIYFIEILAVSICLYYFAFTKNLKRSAIYAVLIFIGLVVIGVVIQNVFA